MTAATQPSGPRVVAWLLVLALAAGVAVLATRYERARPEVGVVLFSPQQPGCAIFIPTAATEGERAAATTLQATLAKAAGRSADDFPVFPEFKARRQAGIWLGATRRGSKHLRTVLKPPFDTGVGYVVEGGALFLKGERREGIESAAGWFLEETLGAQWFMPGPLGEHVPRRAELALAAGQRTARPGFLHRDLGLDGNPESRSWYGRNRLETRFEHGHNLASIFRPADFRRVPEMAPIRSGQRYIPSETTANWQPNLLSPEAVRHAAAFVIREFEKNPGKLSLSLSINDTDLYDESEATLAAVSPARYFRHRPDYSPLVFGFTNAVAELVAKRHPDRWLPAYAYYWCENTPGFRIAKNIVPFLTADRSQWAYPEFAAEDKALIERWCRSGAGIVGVYDYFHGAPNLAPRPLLYAVKESIPFHHRAGVRAFYAETYANWSLDGPKPWLAAKLLWDPTLDPEKLLDLYFREHWAEAAGPMRAFFAVAERTWQEQPGPPLWLRFYNDEDQAWIYPPVRRAELRTHLDRAAKLATSEAVKARVAFVAAGLTVSESYWGFSAARAHASSLAREGADPSALLVAWQHYRAARAEFVRRFENTRRELPHAFSTREIGAYLRNQPDSRIARELARTEAGRARLEQEEHLSLEHLGATAPQVAQLMQAGVETLVDPGWNLPVVLPVGSSAASDWLAAGQHWHGRGEAWEGRSVALTKRSDGRRVLRIAGCRTEDMGQWAQAIPGALYAATINVRAKTSPGTSTHLTLSFLDEKGKHLDSWRVDRLPPDAAVQETKLCVIAKAPPTARFVGFGLRVLNQINDDFAEFSDASLRRLDP